MTHDLFGVPTDFEIKSECKEPGTVTVTVSCVMPRMEYDRANNILRVFPNPKLP